MCRNEPNKLVQQCSILSNLLGIYVNIQPANCFDFVVAFFLRAASLHKRWSYLSVYGLLIALSVKCKNIFNILNISFHFGCAFTVRYSINSQKDFYFYAISVKNVVQILCFAFCQFSLLPHFLLAAIDNAPLKWATDPKRKKQWSKSDITHNK